jgi:demethylmenaquinone methyltransferase/2-methoxy-6-polyprenyl-1,4-benzoquinol methylase
VVLEFSKPTTPFVGFFYNFYMKIVAPNMGKLFSKNGAAYKYLDESIKKFPEGKHFIQVMNELGYTKTEFKKLSFGICCIYVGTK